jgi:hypothetical protein
MSVDERLNEFLKRYENLFDGKPGLYKYEKVKLHLNSDAVPVFLRHRSIPLLLIPKVEAELERLEVEGVISPKKFAEWGTPLVPVVKNDGER